MTKDKSWFRRHWILTGLGALIILAIISSAVSGDDISSGGSSNDDKEAISYGLNDAVRLGVFEYTFTSVEKKGSVGSSYVGAEANGEFLIISLNIENVGNEADYINNEIYIIDGQGREFSQDTSAWIYLDEESIVFEELNPGLTMDAKIIFDVPVGAGGTICIKSSAWSDTCKVYVNLE